MVPVMDAVRVELEAIAFGVYGAQRQSKIRNDRIAVVEPAKDVFKLRLRDDTWPNPRLKTDGENARLSSSLIRHGLAASRSIASELIALP